jgi:hypothetical protein
MPAHNWDTAPHVNKPTSKNTTSQTSWAAVGGKTVLRTDPVFFVVGLLTCGTVSQLWAGIDWKFIEGCLLLYNPASQCARFYISNPSVYEIYISKPTVREIFYISTQNVCEIFTTSQIQLCLRYATSQLSTVCKILLLSSNRVWDTYSNISETHCAVREIYLGSNRVWEILHLNGIIHPPTGLGLINTENEMPNIHRNRASDSLSMKFHSIL